MQIKIDSEKKEITVLETVKITDLLNEIAVLCPQVIDTEEWSITGAYDNYYQPSYIPPVPVFPDFYPQITCDSTEQETK